VEIADFNGKKWHASYNFFSVGNSATNYRLNIAGYSGTAGDQLAHHNNMMFTTKDRDNDAHSSLQCAHHRRGGYWYNGCAFSNLNGLYLSGANNFTGINWRGARSDASFYSFKHVEMKLNIDH
jgi:ficolin